jgi:hypothetical protein
MVNEKKGNAYEIMSSVSLRHCLLEPSPREAAIAIVSYVNDRNPNVSLLALNVGSFDYGLTSLN